MRAPAIERGQAGAVEQGEQLEQLGGLELLEQPGGPELLERVASREQTMPAPMG